MHFSGGGSKLEKYEFILTVSRHISLLSNRLGCLCEMFFCDHRYINILFVLVL